MSVWKAYCYIILILKLPAFGKSTLVLFKKLPRNLAQLSQ